MSPRGGADEIFFDGVRYVSAAQAAADFGFVRDYVARLARIGKIRGKKIGSNWYVEYPAFQEFVVLNEHERSARWTALAEQRRREHPAASEAPGAKKNDPRTDAGTTAPVFSPREYSPSSIASAATSPHYGNRMHATLATALATRSSSSLAGRFASTPAGISDAMLQTSHVPVYALTPAMEFLHKVVALTLAFMLTFGIYALVDPQYAHFAADSVQSELNSLHDSYRTLTGGGFNALARRSETQLASAAENPGLTFAAASSALGTGIPNLLGSLARTWNSSVNNLVYAIAFPIGLTNSNGIVGAPTSGSVAVEVIPYSSTKLATNQTQRTNPVIERVIQTQRIIAAGGITEDILNKKLNDLDARLSGRIFALSTQSSPTTIINHDVFQYSRVSHLSGTVIDDTSIAGSSITGGTIVGTAISATDLSVSGSTALASTTITGDLTVSGAVNFSGTPLTAIDVNFVNATTSTLVATHGSITSLVTADATTTNLHSASFTASNASIASLVTAGATSTSLFSVLSNFTTSVISALTAATATITNLLVTTITGTNATFTNATSTNATTTNLFATNLAATNATTTNFYTTRLSVDTLAANSGIASNLVPDQNATHDLGSPSFFWRNAYVGTLTANNISAASSSIGGTASEDFVINSDNATADTEDMSIVFYGGTVVPNAVLAWNSASGAKRFEFNQPLYIQNQSGSTTQQTLTLKGLSGQTGNLLTLASSTGSAVFSVGPSGSVTALDLTLTSLSGTSARLGTTTITNLAVINTSTSTFAGPVSFGSNLLNIISTGQVALGTASPDASAFLQLDSTSRGFLAPRLTTAQKNAISNPAAGLAVYDTTLNKLNVFNGSVWKNVGSIEIAGEVTSGTAGSILFVDTGSSGPVLAQDNANFSYASSTHRLTATYASSTALTATALFATNASLTYASTSALTISESGAPTTGNLFFGNSTARINYNSSDFTLYGGGLYTNAGRITSIGNNETVGIGVRYVNGDGTYYMGATHSASPDLVFTNNGLTEKARLTDGGFFGIGTTSPWKMLSVAGDIIGTNITATGTLAVAGNTTLANATSTNFFSTTASSTNLFATFATSSSLNTNLLGIGGSNYFSSLTGAGLINNSNTLQIDFTRANSWTGLQQFTAASSTRLSVYGPAYFGATATSTFDSAGNLSVAGTLGVTGNTTLANATSTNFFSTTASSTNLFASIGNIGTLTLGAGTSTAFFATIASSTNLFAQTATLGALTAKSLTITASSGFTGLATFGQASTTLFSALNGAAFGATATSTFDSAGNLSVAGTASVTGKTTLGAASSTNLSASGSFYSPVASAVLLADANKLTTAATTQTCSNQFIRSLSAAYIASCASVSNSDFTGQLAANHGGTGVDSSAFSGIAVIDSGTWSASSTLAVYHGGTGAATFASNGILYGNGTGALQALAVNSTATNKFLTQSSSGAPAWNTIQPADLPGSFAGFANPTATIGLTAVNGSAATAMRSDAVPALSQAITPTWTGLHTFNTGGVIDNASSTFTTTVNFASSGIWNSSGNVGIGTTTPQSLLSIQGGASPTLTLTSDVPTGGAGSPALVLSTASGAEKYTIQRNSSTGFLDFKGTQSSFSGYTWNINNGTEAMRINNSGNLGIGATAPETLLHVATANSATTPVWVATLQNTNNSSGFGYGAGIKFKNSSGTSGNESNKWVGIAGVGGSSNGTGFSNQTDMVFYTNTDTGSSISAPTERMRITGVGNTGVGGNVGIGTASPSAPLEIKSGSTGYPNTSGTTLTGQVLRLKTTSTAVLDLGNDAASGGSFLQATDATGFNFNYALNLNPNGGNVGIGTTNPSLGLLQIEKSTPIVAINNTNTSGFSTVDFSENATLKGAIHQISSSFAVANRRNNMEFVNLSSTGANTFQTNSTERMRIDSVGNVGIGTTGPSFKLQVAGTMLLDGNTAGIAPIFYINDSANTTKVQINSNGNSYLAGGNVGIAETNPTYLLEVASAAGANMAKFNWTSGDPNGVFFNIPNTGVPCGGNYTCSEIIQFTVAGGSIGNITPNAAGTGIVYNTSSDRRIKENIATTTEGLATLMQIPVEDFNFISDPGKTRQQGFIAQEMYKYYPAAVSTNGDNGTDTLASTTRPWGVDYGRLTPLLVQAVQDIANLSDAFKQTLIAWLGDASNGIAEFYATVIHATTGRFSNELCVGDTCVTPAQFQAMVAAANQSGADTSGTGSATPPPPSQDNSASGDPATSSPPTEASPTTIDATTTPEVESPSIIPDTTPADTPAPAETAGASPATDAASATQ
jgi:hypothetical protein